MNQIKEKLSEVEASDISCEYYHDKPFYKEQFMDSIKSTPSFKASFSAQQDPTNSKVEDIFANNCERPTKPTARLLEGGNLFEAVNQQGEKWYFIGINAILNEVQFMNLKKIN